MSIIGTNTITNTNQQPQGSTSSMVIPTAPHLQHHQQLIEQPPTNARTILSTVPIGAVGQINQVMVHQSQSILTTTSHHQQHHQHSILTPVTGYGGDGEEKSVLLKKVKYSTASGATMAAAPNQLITLTQIDSPIMSFNPMSVSMVTSTPTINLISPVNTLTCQPANGTIIAAAPVAPQSMMSFTLQPMGPGINTNTHNSLIATTVPTVQHNSSQPTLSGPSLLVKSELPQPPSSSLTLIEQKQKSRPSLLRGKYLRKLENSSQGEQAPHGCFEEVSNNNNNNKQSTNKQNSRCLTKMNTTKYPAARKIDQSNIPLYYTQKTATSTIKCRLCSKLFSSMTSFQSHFEEHTDQWVFHCNWENCGSFFLSNYKLKRHRRTHTGERPFICQSCGKSYTRSDKLKEHGKQCNGHTSMFADVSIAGEDDLSSPINCNNNSGSSSGPSSLISDGVGENDGNIILDNQNSSNTRFVTSKENKKRTKKNNISISNPSSPTISTQSSNHNTTIPTIGNDTLVLSSRQSTTTITRNDNKTKRKANLRLKINCNNKNNMNGDGGSLASSPVIVMTGPPLIKPQKRKRIYLTSKINNYNNKSNKTTTVTNKRNTKRNTTSATITNKRNNNIPVKINRSTLNRKQNKSKQQMIEIKIEDGKQEEQILNQNNKDELIES